MPSAALQRRIKKAQEMGWDDDRIQRALMNTQLKEDIDKPEGNLFIGPTLGSIAGGALGVFGGPAGIAAGSAIGAGLGTAAQRTLRGESINPKEVAAEAGLGLLGAGAGKAISSLGRGVTKFAGKKAAGAAGKIATKAIRPSPSQGAKFLSKTGEDIGEFAAKRGVFGKELDTVTNLVDTAQSSFDDIAIRSGRKINSSKLIDSIRSRAKKLAKSGTPLKKRQARQLEQYAETAESFLGKNKKVDISLATDLRKQIDSDVRQFSTELSKKTVPEMARDALQNVIRDETQDLVIDGRNLKQLGQELSKLKEFQKIVTRQSQLGKGALPAGLTRLLSFTAGGASGDLTGALAGLGFTELVNNPKFLAALSKGVTQGGKAFAQGSIPKTGLGQIFGQTGTQLLTSGTGGGSQDLGDTSQVFQQQAPQQGFQDSLAQIFQDAYIADLGGTGGKNLEKIQMLQQFYLGENNEDRTEAQVAREDTMNLATEALAQLEGGSIQTGMLAGPIQQTLAKFGLADQDTLDFQTTIASLKASIAKARAGTSFTPNEERLLNQYTPTNKDSRQQVETKLRNMVSFFAKRKLPSSPTDVLFSQ